MKIWPFLPLFCRKTWDDVKGWRVPCHLFPQSKATFAEINNIQLMIAKEYFRPKQLMYFTFNVCYVFCILITVSSELFSVSLWPWKKRTSQCCQWSVPELLRTGEQLCTNRETFCMKLESFSTLITWKCAQKLEICFLQILNNWITRIWPRWILPAQIAMVPYLSLFVQGALVVVCA